MSKFVILIFVLINSGCRLIAPKAGTIRIADDDGMEMVYIPAGYFEMGSAENALPADEDEKPLHNVYLDAYWFDRTEVTNEMYNLCISAGVCMPPARTEYYLNPQYANHPVR